MTLQYILPFGIRYLPLAASLFRLEKLKINNNKYRVFFSPVQVNQKVVLRGEAKYCFSESKKPLQRLSDTETSSSSSSWQRSIPGYSQMDIIEHKTQTASVCPPFQTCYVVLSTTFERILFLSRENLTDYFQKR